LLADEIRKRLSENPSACLKIQAPVWKFKRLSGNPSACLEIRLKSATRRGSTRM
jgi:hypothetical protein